MAAVARYARERHPDGTDCHRQARLSAEQIAAIGKRVLQGRFARAEEMAIAVTLLAWGQIGFFVNATRDLNRGL